MLRSFHIQNFKSLTDFKLDGLGQFGCLIGLNGAGKTTVLQSLDFMAHLATGTVKEWLKERDWSSSDLTSNLLKKQLISFRLEFGYKETLVWEGAYNAALGRCTFERLSILNKGMPFFYLSDGKLDFWRGDKITHDLEIVNFSLDGSILALMQPMLEKNPALSEVLEFLTNIKSLELLAPERMRVKSRFANDVGRGGEKLSGFLHGLSKYQKLAVLEDVQHFYSHIGGYDTKAKRAGWAEFSALENFGNGNGRIPLYLNTNAQHLNDGLLRIFTIVAQTKTDHQFLLFDEIENGINPEKIGQLVKYLLEAKQQIMVTTHNPLILNFLPEEKARESVFFLYRNRYGATKATRFYEIPEVAEKLDVLGPGEAFLDTSLEELVARIESREEAKS